MRSERHLVPPALGELQVQERAGLLAAALRKAPGVHAREADLVDQVDDDSLGVRVVTGDGHRQPLLGGKFHTTFFQQTPEVDGVERLDDGGFGQQRSEQLRRADPVVVELGESAVPVGVVVLASMTILPAKGAGGRSRMATSGIATATTAP